MCSKDIQLSKSLSWLLRHGAVKEGLRLSPEGYIDVSEILQHKSFRGKYATSDIERVVANNDKQRFKLRRNPQTKHLEVKANQGHTVTVSNAELIPILEPKYKTVVHGTYSNCWPQIKAEGLSRMKRQHIHLAKGTLEDRNVISGLRRNIQVYIFIDLEKALDDGLKFYESENGVILTQGNEKGYLELKYFEKAVEVSTGFPPYAQTQDLVACFSKFGQVRVEKMTNRYACLAFPTAEEARAAIQASKQLIVYGEFLTVREFAAAAPDLPPPPKASPRRNFIRSKEKGVIVEPKEIDLSGDFLDQLDSILARVRLTQEEATNIGSLYADVEKVLQALWPGCVAMPFGSITTGLGIKSSDADCYVRLPDIRRTADPQHVNRAKRILQSYPHLFAEILSIPRANTPIVKFFHMPTETNCDLTFKTPLGSQNSKLIAFLLHSDPRLIPVAVFIKYWAKVHGFSGTGKLTNYALTMMIIFYLQQPPMSILPSVEWLQRDRRNDVIVDYWNTGFMSNRDQLPPSSNTSSISELLGGFFEFYSTFNFGEMVVCPYLGAPIKKTAFSNVNQLPNVFETYRQNVLQELVYPLRHATAMCVQDPFEQSHNVASAISGKLAAEIKAYITFAANAYEKDKLNNCKEFLKTILLEKPKLPKAKPTEFRVCLFPRLIVNIKDKDWISVVRQVIFTIFETLLKIKLNRVEEKVNTESKKIKELFAGTLTKAIWKRKQFSRIYIAMNLDFKLKQSRITEEVMKVEKETLNIPILLTITYARSPRSANVVIKQADGDSEMFKDFGSFFISVLQNWFVTLLKPEAKPPAIDTAAKIAETIQVVDGTNEPNTSIDSDDISVVSETTNSQESASEKDSAVTHTDVNKVQPNNNASKTRPHNEASETLPNNNSNETQTDSDTCKSQPEKASETVIDNDANETQSDEETSETQSDKETSNTQPFKKASGTQPDNNAGNPHPDNASETQPDNIASEMLTDNNAREAQQDKNARVVEPDNNIFITKPDNNTTKIQPDNDASATDSYASETQQDENAGGPQPDSNKYKTLTGYNGNEMQQYNNSRETQPDNNPNEQRGNNDSKSQPESANETQPNNSSEKTEDNGGIATNHM